METIGIVLLVAFAVLGISEGIRQKKELVK